MDSYNIFICGVGGQGIGILNEVLIHAVDYAGHKVKAVDTHGLAQRGGTVISNLRFGDNVNSPLIPEGSADMVIALEMYEALRAMNGNLKIGGTLVYYKTELQPLELRLTGTGRINHETISSDCKKRNIVDYKVYHESLPNINMQNIIVLGCLCKNSLIPGLTKEHYIKALEDAIPDKILELNMKYFLAEL